MAIEREKADISRGAAKIERTSRVIGRSQPDFDSVFEEDDNPLDNFEPSGDLQSDADGEMSEILKAIIERKHAAAERYRVTNDPEYYLVVCFQSHDQKDQFIERSGWDEFGEKFISGLDVARKLGVPVDVIELDPPKLRGKPGKFNKADVIHND